MTLGVKRSFGHFAGVWVYLLVFEGV
jgi:hypothetical protein